MKVMLCDDIEWLLSDEAFSIYSFCMYKPTYEGYKKQMEQYISDSSTKIFVCESEYEKVGILVLDQSNRRNEIKGIAVSEKHRRHGIGKIMICQVMDSEQLETIEAQTDDDAIGFYRKCGFSENMIVIEYPDGSFVRYNCSLIR